MLLTNWGTLLGSPVSQPTALRRVEILGLQSDCCKNFTALERMRTECVNMANATGGTMCGARSTQGQGRDRTFGPGAEHTFSPMGNVQKSVDGSL